MQRRNRRLGLILLIMLSGYSSGLIGAEKKAPVGLLGGGEKVVTKTMPERVLISASSARGSSAYHRHLVMPGLKTSYLIRVFNPDSEPVSVELALSEIPQGWSAQLEKTRLNLNPGAESYILLNLSASAQLPVGTVASVLVKAKSSGGETGEIIVEAETSNRHKIYFISIDSFGTEYLKLNSRGDGLGKEGDWLTPHLHNFIKESISFPEHKAHLISATDMNHSSFLTGAYPGRLGIYSVNVFLFGFDEKGNPLVRSTPVDIMYWGKEGKPVITMFNVLKDPAYGGNPNAFTAFISGKAWMPEHYLNPVFGLDRVATVNRYPDYVKPTEQEHKINETLKQILTLQLGKFRDSDYFLWEDSYTAEQAIEVIQNEDPDLCYILLGGVDAAGHTYGAGYDLEEWKSGKNPESLADDVSRVNWRANREGIIKTVKNADLQLGKLINFLKERGVYDQSYIIVESDHNMETNFFQGPPLDKIAKSTGYSPKKDYFLFTISQIAALFARPGNQDPEMIANLEQAFEQYRMKNPLTGKLESPLIAINRQEMKTGIDQATGEKITEPGELYSEYYIEYPQPGALVYPDLIILARKYYQFPLSGVGLASIGLGTLDIPLPRVNVFVGGHGGPSTQPALLAIKLPGMKSGKISETKSLSADVAPTIYDLEGYKIPDCVQGKKLK